MGKALAPRVAAPARPLAARARRQQRRHRRAQRRPRPRRARRSLLRRRHGRSALHEPAPADRARERSPTSSSTGSPRPIASVTIGDPREPGTLVGPLVTGEAFGRMEAALERARERRRRGRRRRRARAGRAAGRTPGTPSPTIVRMPAQTDVVREETFAPILYVLTYRELDEAIALQNDVPQGLASSIFTTDLREAERVPRCRRLRLRHRERQHRPERGRDRRRLRRGEGDRRRPRVRLGCLACIHAAADRDGQLLERPAARPGHRLRHPLAKI